MSRIVTSVETITPQMAQELLERNKINRKLRDDHVRTLAKEMVEGRWKVDGQSIIIDEEGNLLNGQHRLWASFNSNVSFTSIVVRNVDRSAFVTIDSGMKRSAGDALALSGIKYGIQTAAIIRLVHFVSTGARDHRAISAMSNSETVALFSKYPGVEECAALVACTSNLRKLMPPSPLGATMYFALKHNRQKALEFFDAIITGENLRRGDPRLSLRNFYLNRNAQRPNSRVQLALLIKAWNAWIMGRELTVIKFLDGEEFPTFAHLRPTRRRAA